MTASDCESKSLGLLPWQGEHATRALPIAYYWQPTLAWSHYHCVKHDERTTALDHHKRAAFDLCSLVPTSTPQHGSLVHECCMT